MADPIENPSNPPQENQENPKSPLSNPEARHETQSIDSKQPEDKGTQGSAISRLFKPKGHRKAASLKALRSEDEPSQLDTNPEVDTQIKMKESGLQDIPSIPFRTEGENESQNESKKTSFFSRLKFNWFSKGNAEILQEEDSQNVTRRSVNLKNVKKTKLEGVYDTEREFMESVMTEKNVMDSYRIDGNEKVQSKALVNSENSGSSKILMKVLIGFVICLLIGGLVLGGLYIKNNATSEPTVASHPTAPGPKVSFTDFGSFTQAAASFKPEEVVKVSSSDNSSPERESIFKEHTVFFNGLQEIVEKKSVETNFIVKNSRRLQDGKPNAIPQTRTEKSESEEIYRMITYKNVYGKAESIISFEGKLENGQVVLLGTNKLVELQDVVSKHAYLKKPLNNGGTRLLAETSNKLRKLAPSFSNMDQEFEIEELMKPQCYKPMIKVLYNDKMEVSGVIMPTTQYDEILEEMLDIVETLNPVASRQYYQDNDKIETDFSKKDHVLIKTQDSQTQYDQYGNQKEFTQVEQSSIYSKDSQLLSQVKKVSSNLPTDNQEGEIASVNTVVERKANLQKLAEDSIDFTRQLFDLVCKQNHCETQNLAEYTNSINTYIKDSKSDKVISSNINTESAPIIKPLPVSGEETIKPFAMTLFDVTTMGVRTYGFYEVKAVGKEFEAKMTLNIGGESHVIFQKTGDIDYLANIHKVRKIFTAILVKFNKITTYVKDKFKGITNHLGMYKTDFEGIVKQSILDVKGFNIKTTLPDYAVFNLIGDDLTLILNNFKSQIGATFDLIVGEFQDEIIEIREYMITPIIYDLNQKLELLQKIEDYFKRASKISPDFKAKLVNLQDMLTGEIQAKLLNHKLNKFNENYDHKKELFHKIITNLLEQIETLSNEYIKNPMISKYAKKALHTFFSENYLRHLGTAIKHFKTEIKEHFTFGSQFVGKITLDINKSQANILALIEEKGEAGLLMDATPEVKQWFEFLEDGPKIYEEYNTHNTGLISLERVFRLNNKPMMEAYYKTFQTKFKVLENSLEASKAKIMHLLYGIEKSYMTTFKAKETEVHALILEFWNQVQTLFTSFSTYLHVKKNVQLMDETTLPDINLHDLRNLGILRDEMNDIINYQFHNVLEGYKKEYMTIFQGFIDLKPDISKIINVYNHYDTMDSMKIDIKMEELSWFKKISVKSLLDLYYTTTVQHSNLLLVTIPHQIVFHINDQVKNKIIGRISSFFTTSLTKLTKDTIDSRSAFFLKELKEEVPKKEGNNLLFKEINNYEKIIRSKGLSNDIFTKFEFHIDSKVFLTYNCDLLTSNAGVDSAFNVHVQVTSAPSNRIAGTESIYTGALVDGRIYYGNDANAIPKTTVKNSGYIDLNLFKTISGVRKWKVNTSYSCLSEAEAEKVPAKNPTTYKNLHRFMADVLPTPADYKPQVGCNLCTPKMTYKFSNPTFIDKPIENKGYNYKKVF